MDGIVPQTPPNPSDGTPCAPTTTGTLGPACGSASEAGTAGRVETLTVSRVQRVQIDGLTDAEWTDLRQLACECARFCNAKMADFYAAVLGYTMPQSTERRAGGRLSGDTYVALGREAWTQWKRHGKRILAGAQRLAEFQADRAIVCRAEYMSKGRRQRRAMVVREGDRYRLVIRLVKAAIGPRHDFALRWKPQSDDYISPVLESLASGETRLLKVSLVFERPGRKVFALLTYERTIRLPPMGARTATLGPLEDDGTLWLRVRAPEGRRADKPYTQDVLRLLHMKIHFDGIRKRLKRQRRMRHAGRWQDYRRALVKAGTFSAWAKGPLHQMSADIIAHCRRHGVGQLALGPMVGHDLPMHVLTEQIKWKAAEAGIEIVALDPVEPSADRAVARPVEKRRQRIAAKRKALATLKEGL